MAKPVAKIQDEDTLECFIYTTACYKNPESINEVVLNDEISKFNEFFKQYTQDYIWHRDALILQPRLKQSILFDQLIQGTSKVLPDSSIVPHIYGKLQYDEDVGDEWFTVFLIIKLTELIKGLIARLVDSDGEFLLIETADYLPRWAEPESCQDNVFIFDGRIHIIQDRKLSMFDKLKRISENSQNYLLSNKAQECIRKRIGVYPDELEKRKHKARAFLPEKAASILAQHPGLVAPAVRAIVHSDPFERKVCRAMRYFPPEQRIMVNVKMTKCLYAMSSHCRYTGDPRTGWNFPPTNSPKYNAHLLGIKLACGLEMLVANANEQLRKKDRSDGEIDPKQLKTYVDRLKSIGYFKDTLPGSKEYEELLNSAKNYLKLNSLPVNIKNSNDDDVALKVLTAWKNVKTEDFEMLAQDEASLSPPDDDSWLNIDAAQLESTLGKHWNVDGSKSHPEPPNIKEKVKTFLNQTSDVYGVEFAREDSREDDGRQENDDVRIEFDADVFDSTLRDILDLVVPGGDGEFDGSSEGSLGGDEDDGLSGEMNKYMKLLDSQLEMELTKDTKTISSQFKDSIESNLIESMEEEAGGAGPAGNIIGGPVRRLMHLQLQSPTTIPTTVPPDLQS